MSRSANFFHIMTLLIESKAILKSTRPFSTTELKYYTHPPPPSSTKQYWHNISNHHQSLSCLCDICSESLPAKWYDPGLWGCALYYGKMISVPFQSSCCPISAHHQAAGNAFLLKEWGKSSSIILAVFPKLVFQPFSHIPFGHLRS